MSLSCVRSGQEQRRALREWGCYGLVSSTSAIQVNRKDTLAILIGVGGAWLGTYNHRQISKREQTNLSMGVSCDAGASRTKDPKGKKVNVILVSFLVLKQKLSL